MQMPVHRQDANRKTMEVLQGHAPFLQGPDHHASALRPQVNRQVISRAHDFSISLRRLSLQS
jgi:hypothetical protein